MTNSMGFLEACYTHSLLWTISPISQLTCTESHHFSFHWIKQIQNEQEVAESREKNQSKSPCTVEGGESSGICWCVQSPAVSQGHVLWWPKEGEAGGQRQGGRWVPSPPRDPAECWRLNPREFLICKYNNNPSLPRVRWGLAGNVPQLKEAVLTVTSQQVGSYLELLLPIQVLWKPHANSKLFQVS